ncbi:MAG: transposase, partial [Deltaproteobacteria bacterium]|nr:transposase [Deltaproteobacteria bacterium]
MGPALQRAPTTHPCHYERRRPEETVLHRLVQENLETFFAQVEAERSSGLPEFVKDEFDAFLACGVLAHGFLRLRCSECGCEKLVAFSCKRRGFCPSCGARRMAETAAHLVDHVIPLVPVRQWVLSLPIPLRLLLAAQPQLLAPLLHTIHRAIAGFLVKRAGSKLSRADTGMVTLIQRFGSAANLNIHLHCLVLDGVYLNRDGVPLFHEAAPPTVEELEALLAKIITRTMRLLTRLGAVIEEPDQTYLAETDTDGALKALHAASCTYRIALGPRAGQKVLSLQRLPSQVRPSAPELRVNAHGFSLHAALRWGADQRKELEQLCRYIARPAIANERIKRNRAGQIVLQLKSPYKDGTTHIVMEPLEFMERLAALVPRPRLHLIRFHGVLAPNAKLRSQIVPTAPLEPPSEAPTAEAPAQKKTPRVSWARLLKRVFDLDIE